jgi:hypothetical protein
MKSPGRLRPAVRAVLTITVLSLCLAQPQVTALTHIFAPLETTPPIPPVVAPYVDVVFAPSLPLPINKTMFDLSEQQEASVNNYHQVVWAALEQWRVPRPGERKTIGVVMSGSIRTLACRAQQENLRTGFFNHWRRPALWCTSLPT